MNPIQIVDDLTETMKADPNRPYSGYIVIGPDGTHIGEIVWHHEKQVVELRAAAVSDDSTGPI